MAKKEKKKYYHVDDELVEEGADWLAMAWESTQSDEPEEVAS